MASAMIKRARRKFDKLADLNDVIAAGGFAGNAARRSKAKMNDSWSKRGSSSTVGFYDAKKAREIKRGVV